MAQAALSLSERERRRRGAPLTAAGVPTEPWNQYWQRTPSGPKIRGPPHTAAPKSDDSALAGGESQHAEPASGSARLRLGLQPGLSALGPALQGDTSLSPQQPPSRHVPPLQRFHPLQAQALAGDASSLVAAKAFGSKRALVTFV